MRDLNLEFFPLQNRSETDLGFPSGHRVGRIVLSVQENEKKHIVLDIIWDFDELVSWFNENRAYMESESLPNFVEGGRSIYKSIEATYENFDAYLDDQLDELFEYRHRHEVCFGMRGVKIPAIYIGIGE